MKERYTDYQILFEIGVPFQFNKYTLSLETYQKRELLWSLMNNFIINKNIWLNKDLGGDDVSTFVNEVSKSEESEHRVYGKHCSYRHSNFL